jgi:hypothetical protein
MVENGTGDALGKEAQRQTAAIMQSLRFRQIYGFYPGSDYRLPIRKSGEFPPIKREQFPQQVQQLRAHCGGNCGSRYSAHLAFGST